MEGILCVCPTCLNNGLFWAYLQWFGSSQIAQNVGRFFIHNSAIVNVKDCYEYVGLMHGEVEGHFSPFLVLVHLSQLKYEASSSIKKRSSSWLMVLEIKGQQAASDNDLAGRAPHWRKVLHDERQHTCVCLFCSLSLFLYKYYQVFDPATPPKWLYLILIIFQRPYF